MARYARPALDAATACVVFLFFSGTVRAEVHFGGVDSGSGARTARLTNSSPFAQDLNRWRVGDYAGWNACLPIGNASSAEGDVCACLDRQLSAVTKDGVEVAISEARPCAAIFIEGAWISSWGQAVAAQAPVALRYDPATRSISGCWAEPSGAGAITGVIRNGAFNIREKRLTFAYDDLQRGVSGVATVTLWSTPRDLTLLGNWGDAERSGAWTMIRDPVRKPLDCAAPAPPAR